MYKVFLSGFANKEHRERLISTMAPYEEQGVFNCVTRTRENDNLGVEFLSEDGNVPFDKLILDGVDLLEYATNLSETNCLALTSLEYDVIGGLLQDIAETEVIRPSDLLAEVCRRDGVSTLIILDSALLMCCDIPKRQLQHAGIEVCCYPGVAGLDDFTKDFAGSMYRIANSTCRDECRLLTHHLADYLDMVLEDHADLSGVVTTWQDLTHPLQEYAPKRWGKFQHLKFYTLEDLLVSALVQRASTHASKELRAEDDEIGPALRQFVKTNNPESEAVTAAETEKVEE